MPNKRVYAPEPKQKGNYGNRLNNNIQRMIYSFNQMANSIASIRIKL